jgi:N6-L-threonylcarbamoyladenine synthase
MIIGIESSCDESALALFDPEAGMGGEWVHSQIQKHQAHGGIVPDLASREHLDNFPAILGTLLAVHVPGPGDQVAVTAGPGLAGCLALGISLAQALSLAFGIPVCGVNHLRGHAFSPFIGLHGDDPEAFPARYRELLPHLGLIVSGGNTILFSIDRAGRLSVLADTVDDAAGEALDKGAKLLGMPYPGGPLIEAAACGGDPAAYAFPRAFPGREEARFSFSGLKTSLRYRLEKLDEAAFAAARADICASYQEAVVDALTRKLKQFLETAPWASIGLSGGVANNRRLRTAFGETGARAGLPALIAQAGHTGDNAAMIAFAAYLDPDGVKPDATAFDPSWELA